MRAWTLMDQFPVGCVGAGDFFRPGSTGALQVTTGDGTQRAERVLVAAKRLQYGPSKGPIAIGEQTVAEMADVLGFPTPQTFAKLQDENEILRTDAATWKIRYEALRTRLSALQQETSAIEFDEDTPVVPDDLGDLTEDGDNTEEIPVIAKLERVSRKKVAK